LAIAMAERITRRQLEGDRDLLAAMARAGIARLGNDVVASIHLHPDDFEATSSGRDAGAGSAISIVADRSIPQGGCRVHSTFGIIDVGIDAQIHELSRALLGEEPGKNASDDVLAGA
jgi:flagellar assembly protein FliH